MSKFKNKKALALSVGAIMAGVSVIGIVAACAPTKAKPNKPTEKKVEQPQTGGNQSSNPGSGSTTAGSKQGSETGGSTNTNPETGSTTNTTKQGSENSGTTNSSGGSTNTNPGSGNSSNPGNQGSQNGGSTEGSNGSTNTNPGTGGENNGSQSGETPDSSNSSTNTNPGTGGENSGSQNGGSTENTKNKELENKKKEIKEKISKLPYLSEADKKSFNDQVDTITDPSKANELDTIFTKAQKKDNEEKVKKEEAEKAKAFETKKNEAKDAITKLNSLLTSDKEKYKENIDAVVKIEEAQKIDQIVKEATIKIMYVKTNSLQLKLYLKCLMIITI
ncbi:hypothetical protein JM47_00855 [Ureaplasma diversum]|uniref:Protein G-related albumin-binding (GA) module domain-containing protein n=1 Tax=Ureaplasma diversum TaxID=42094 RepID=A0A0C5RL82_9BACT|nr:GA module-containing protein [Ureaplasma diversum]AJQ45192.1 hypothetical protein JM47_00855 [Ureaplasma diversum]